MLRLCHKNTDKAAKSIIDMVSPVSGSLRAPEVVGMKTVHTWTLTCMPINACAFRCGKCILAGPRSPGHIILLSQAHRQSNMIANVYICTGWDCQESSWRHEREHCQGLLEGRSLIKGSSVLPSKGVRLCACPPVCCVCDICVHVSRKGQWSLSGWDAFTLYGCSHQDSSLRPGLHEVRNIAAQVLNGFCGLCLWDQELFLRRWESW